MNAFEETLQVLYNISFAFLNFWVVLRQCDNEIIRCKLDPSHSLRDIVHVAQHNNAIFLSYFLPGKLNRRLI